MMDEPQTVPATDPTLAERRATNLAKARAARKTKLAAQSVARAAAKLDDYDGISPTECPLACNVNRCVITGEGICGHPQKGGLQAKFMADVRAVERYRQARIRLAQQRVKEM